MGKYVVLLLLVFTTACTQSDKVPTEEDFKVTIQTTEDTFKANTSIVLDTRLINEFKNSVEVWHASPLIQVQIYDEENNPLVDMFSFDQIGLHYNIKPGEMYKPDPKEKRTIEIEKTGVYRLVATAHFSIELSNGDKKEYKISSESYEITIK